MSKPFLFALALVTSLLASSLASAEPRPLSEKRSRPYYWTHGSLAAGGLALGVAATPLVGEHRGHYWGSFYPDDLVELRFSESASALSDHLLVTTITLPLLVQMSQGFDTSMANATLIYGQAHALNLALTATTKLMARRSRPYTRRMIRAFRSLRTTRAPRRTCPSSRATPARRSPPRRRARFSTPPAPTSSGPGTPFGGSSSCWPA